MDESSISLANPHLINQRIQEIEILNADILERLEEVDRVKFEEIINEIHQNYENEISLTTNNSIS